MARDDVRAKKSGGLFKFLLLNILPIGGLIALVWGVNQGKISLDDLPGGLGRNALYFGISIALLIITASLLLPMVRTPCAGRRRCGWCLRRWLQTIQDSLNDILGRCVLGTSARVRSRDIGAA